MVGSVQRYHIDSISRQSYLNEENPYTTERLIKADEKSLTRNEKWEFVGLRTHAKKQASCKCCVMSYYVITFYSVTDLWVKRHVPHHNEHNEHHAHRVHSAWEVLRIEHIMAKHILARHHSTFICTCAHWLEDVATYKDFVARSWYLRQG